jgi:hypothetical protein
MNGPTVIQALPVANVGTTWTLQNVNANWPEAMLTRDTCAGR